MRQGTSAKQTPSNSRNTFGFFDFFTEVVVEGPRCYLSLVYLYYHANFSFFIKSIFVVLMTLSGGKWLWRF